MSKQLNLIVSLAIKYRRKSAIHGGMSLAYIQWYLIFLDSQIDVLIQICAAIGKDVYDDWIGIEVHIQHKFDNFLSEWLHCVTLPEDILNRRRISNRNQSAIHKEMRAGTMGSKMAYSFNCQQKTNSFIKTDDNDIVSIKQSSGMPLSGKTNNGTCDMH